MLKNTAKHLIFLDIDGTLLDPEYRINCSELKLRLKSLQSQGNFVFCLNSNRSLQDLFPIAKQFDISGPLVCENGLFAYLPRSKKKILLTNKKNIEKMIKVKKNFKFWILETAQILKKSVYYKKTDTVKLINKVKKNNFPGDSILVFDNKYRKYTVSAHIKRLVSGALTKDLLSLRKLEIIVRKKIKQLGLSKIIEVGTSEVFGNLLIYSKLINKRTGVKYLISKYYRNYKVIAIGDESSDANMVEGLGEFWMVGNGTKDAKKSASKIAKYKYTKGVNELLKKYDRKNKNNRR
ncbi:MAG: HAD hydrolase family protein [bacterium]|nr:HAD hydrolase family protein [bacterium]